MPLRLRRGMQGKNFRLRIKSAIGALCSLKKKGRRVGRLKFKSAVNSIPLKQPGNTYRILDKRHIKIQNIKEPLRVFGIDQLQERDLANANLIQRSGDFYLMVTCFESKNDNFILN